MNKPFAVKRPRYDDSGFTCPVCGAKLRCYGSPHRSTKYYGGTRWIEQKYTCPVDENEIYLDPVEGMRRIDGAKHEHSRVYTADELRSSSAS